MTERFDRFLGGCQVVSRGAFIRGCVRAHVRLPVRLRAGGLELELERFFGRFEALKFSAELVDDFGFSLGDVRRRFIRVFALRECLLKPSHVTQRLLRLHLRVTQRGSRGVAFFRERVRGFLVRFFGE